MEKESLDQKICRANVEKYRVSYEREIGIEFASLAEVEKAVSFLDKEQLPFLVYGGEVLGVYKPVRDYLKVSGFEFRDLQIGHIRYPSAQKH